MRSLRSICIVAARFAPAAAHVAGIAVLAIHTLVAGAALGRSWRVELDGLGDFLDIQPAAEAAAPGDTILIGPGRFEQLHEFVTPGWTDETVVLVTKDNLTFIGAGADQTFVGKSSPYRIPGRYPAAFRSLELYDVTFKSMSIENMFSGIYWYDGTLKVEDCEFRGLVSGMTFWADGGYIKNCLFDLSRGETALRIGFSGGFEVADCRFVGDGQGLDTGGNVRDVNFTNCVFDGNYVALRYDNQCTGILSNVTITGASAAGIIIARSSEVTVDGGRIDGGEYWTSPGSLDAS